MNSRELIENIHRLKETINRYDFSIKIADVILYDICDGNDPNAIELLIGLLDDDFEYDEFMFSIVHCIEKFDNTIYLHHLLNTLPDLIYKSPRWASILHMRIINNEKAYLEYIKVIIREATNLQKGVIGDLLNSIAKENPEFLSKIGSLFVVCKMG